MTSVQSIGASVPQQRARLPRRYSTAIPRNECWELLKSTSSSRNAPKRGYAAS